MCGAIEIERGCNKHNTNTNTILQKYIAYSKSKCVVITCGSRFRPPRQGRYWWTRSKNDSDDAHDHLSVERFDTIAASRTTLRVTASVKPISVAGWNHFIVKHFQHHERHIHDECRFFTYKLFQATAASVFHRAYAHDGQSHALPHYVHWSKYSSSALSHNCLRLVDEAQEVTTH